MSGSDDVFFSNTLFSLKVLVEVVGIEPTSEAFQRRRSTSLVCDFSYPRGEHKHPTRKRSLLKFRMMPACQQHQPIP
jgi:hypothetical protein